MQEKTKQLKKLFEKYQAKKQEVGDAQEHFQLEREGYLEDYRILTQQVGAGLCSAAQAAELRCCTAGASGPFPFGLSPCWPCSQGISPPTSLTLPICQRSGPWGAFPV